jgi:hypothetical protein
MLSLYYPQWGLVESCDVTGTIVYFPITFPNSIARPFLTSGAGQTSYVEYPQWMGLTAAGFTWFCTVFNQQEVKSGTIGGLWGAIGC